eukprot:TRINITY_DN18565_c0_g1_i2.p1 TRINITY_DN18565_c0_g1~~TRINITY_DN18565_c0_g1_i2.p1  ORF type:complete len:209 (-),score=38.73 TRINITY_DN18565_c0_g1_i2:11-637(-)
MQTECGQFLRRHSQKTISKKVRIKATLIENSTILCLNECRISQEDLRKSKIMEEFNSTYPYQYWNSCKNASKGYSGVSILSKMKPINCQFDIGISKHDQEGRTLTAEYDKFVLVACYVPNAGDGLKRLQYRTTEWDPDFRSYLKKTAETTKKPLILCGDLNCAHNEIDIALPKSHKRSPGFTIEERTCLLYTSPSPRDATLSRMPSSA